MQLVKRTLAVLRILGDSPGLTMQELATSLDVPLPSMHRLLATLTEEEFVVRTDERQFVLGPAALALARGRRQLEDVARPFMRELSATTGETVFLTRLVGRRAICVAMVEGTRALRLFVAVGQSMPFHAAASARVLLVDRSPDEVAALLGEGPPEAYTATTPTTPAAVARHLDDVRRDGYDVCREELDPNVLAVSAPIRNAAGEVEASLTVAAPWDRHEGAETAWAPDLVAATTAISRELGGPAPARS